MVKDYLKRVKLPFVEGILENALGSGQRDSLGRVSTSFRMPARAAEPPTPTTTNTRCFSLRLATTAPSCSRPVRRSRVLSRVKPTGVRGIVDEISYGADVIYPGARGGLPNTRSA